MNLVSAKPSIIWSSTGILIIRTSGTNFSEILGAMYTFSFKKMHLKCHQWNESHLFLASMCWIPILKPCILYSTTQKCSDLQWYRGCHKLHCNEIYLYLLMFNLRYKVLVDIYQWCSFCYSLWPNDTIWWQRSGSTLAQVMACFLMAPSHFLNQCWFTISKVYWHSSANNFTTDTSAINH